MLEVPALVRVSRITKMTFVIHLLPLPVPLTICHIKPLSQALSSSHPLFRTLADHSLALRL